MKRLEINKGLAARCSLLVLPVCYLAAALWTRSAGGPLWLWFNLDPDYFYLLDALNIVNLTTPGHVYHPGTTVQWLGALILKLAHPLSGAEAVTGHVLADPEWYLGLIGTVFVVLNALAAVALGAAGAWVFGGPLAAWVLQMAPLISMVVLKNSYHVKPEALLLFTVLVLAAVSVLSLKPGLLERRRMGFAVAFGVIAGFGVATKVTALPVFVLPLLVLWGGGGGLRPLFLYGVFALAALMVFTAPALGAYEVFFAWLAKVSQGTGAYGGGPAGFVDWAAYPKGVLKLFKRPAFHVVFILSVLTLAAAAWRRRRGRPLPGPEVRLLAGVVAAQLAQVLLVAKQPSAHYLIPSLALIPLALVLVWRLAGAWWGEGGPARRRLGLGMAVLLAALVPAQGYGVFKLTREHAANRDTALSIGDDRFSQCARIYSYAASNQSFALFLGDFLTGSRFSERLAAGRPANDYWLEHWWDQSRLVFRGWRGPEDMAAVIGRYPCTVFRSGNWPLIKKLLPKTVSGLTFDATCRARHETIKTIGVDCDGRALR
ncbi:MAG: hypothetical protein IIC06_00665 [Proteobacteria bacterium]|nr:hypothetical protein [Pseudomonadota bacterium]